MLTAYYKGRGQTDTPVLLAGDEHDEDEAVEDDTDDGDCYAEHNS